MRGMRNLRPIWCFVCCASFHAAAFAQCPKHLYDPSVGQPILDSVRLKSPQVEGVASSVPVGATLQLCVVSKSGLKTVMAQPIIANGRFSIKPPDPFEVGDRVSVQVVVPSSPETYGRESEVATVPESCEASVTPVSGEAPPTLSITKDESGKTSLSGKVADPKGKSIRICVDDVPIKEKPSIDSKGAFALGSLDLKESAKVNAQILITTAQGKQQFGSISLPSTVPKAPEEPQSGFRYIFIAGVEEASYSSMGLTTEPFVQLYLEGNEHRYRPFGWTAPWGKVRLLAAPQPSTNGIGSTFTDPTGTITKQDFTKIGQSIDVMGGVQKFLVGKGEDQTRLGLIAWAGTTTPLSSQDVAYTFKVPDVSTVECKELLNRFTSQNGYNPGLTTDPNGKTCLVNGTTAVTDIAFANQDRTNFLFKWGAGIRIVGTEKCIGSSYKCLPALAMLDATIGQDATVTRGLVRHFVGKADGVLPVPATKNFVYLFGSVYTRLERNRDYPPLILASETNKPTLPNAAVVILPLKQPERDFFRLGSWSKPKPSVQQVLWNF